MKEVVVHSDGGCRGNPGPGAWAVVLEHGPHRRELTGFSPATTNNRMELQAAIAALEALKLPCVVSFYTDSKYVQNGIQSWLKGWKYNGWKTKAKQPVKNADLWMVLDQASSRHKITWHWLKGHAGHALNERCDILLNETMDRMIAQTGPAELKKALKAFEEQKTPLPRSGEELKL
jgi:ribonuclease HI